MYVSPSFVSYWPCVDIQPSSASVCQPLFPRPIKSPSTSSTRTTPATHSATAVPTPATLTSILRTLLRLRPIQEPLDAYQCLVCVRRRAATKARHSPRIDTVLAVFRLMEVWGWSEGRRYESNQLPTRFTPSCQHSLFPQPQYSFCDIPRRHTHLSSSRPRHNTVDHSINPLQTRQPG